MINKTGISRLSSSTIAYSIITISILAMVIIAFAFNGTGDDGDSITHYIHAHNAYNHPQSLIDHWAKPLYVLLASPWAYWGFTGMKLFNVFCLAITLLFTYKLAVHFNYKNAWLAPLIILFYPQVIVLTLSGLTEPLFAAWMIVGIYFLVKEKEITGSLWLSFLPFVRSEGLIILSVVLIYFIIKGKWKLLPLLTIGHIVYGLVGMFHYGTPLWVFKQMPYAHLSTPYGVGEWTHFFKNMHEITGRYFNYVLLIGILIGGIRMIQYWKNPKKNPFSKKEMWLVYAGFSAVFVGHTIFWALGIFWSFGLLRIFIGVTPLMALITLYGFNYLIEFTSRFHKYAASLFMIIFLALGIINLKTSLKKAQFELSALQVLQEKLATKYGNAWLNENPRPIIYYNTPYLALVLPEYFNYFDFNVRRRASNLYDGSPLPKHFYYIWDEVYGFWEGGGPISKAFSDKRIKLVSKESEFDKYYNMTRFLYVFTKDTSSGVSKGVLFDQNKIDKDSSRFEKNAEYSGQRVIKVDKSNPYSLGYKQYIRLIAPADKAIRLRVTCKVKLGEFPRDDWNYAKVVFSIRRNGKDFYWDGIPIHSRLEKNSEWQDFFVDQVLPMDRTADDLLEVMIWYEYESPIYVKDLKVELMD